MCRTTFYSRSIHVIVMATKKILTCCYFIMTKSLKGRDEQLSIARGFFENNRLLHHQSCKDSNDYQNVCMYMQARFTRDVMSRAGVIGATGPPVRDFTHRTAPRDSSGNRTTRPASVYRPTAGCGLRAGRAVSRTVRGSTQRRTTTRTA